MEHVLFHRGSESTSTEEQNHSVVPQCSYVSVELPGYNQHTATVWRTQATFIVDGQSEEPNRDHPHSLRWRRQAEFHETGALVPGLFLGA